MHVSGFINRRNTKQDVALDQTATTQNKNPYIKEEGILQSDFLDCGLGLRNGLASSKKPMDQQAHTRDSLLDKLVRYMNLLLPPRHKEEERCVLDQRSEYDFFELTSPAFSFRGDSQNTME